MINQRLQEYMIKLYAIGQTEKRIPIIIKVHNTNQETIDYLRNKGVIIDKIFKTFNQISGWATISQIRSIDKFPVLIIYLNEQVRSLQIEEVSPLTTNVNPIPYFSKLLKANELHELGITGKGVKVAVLDTGINSAHPLLRGKVIKDIKLASGDIHDGYGHGTHVAGIIAGSDTGTDYGDFVGVAPDSELINIKVLDDNGSGSLTTIIEGIEKAYTNGAKVINMSLGANFDSGGDDPISDAISHLADKIFFIVAVGNSGPNSRTVGTPATSINTIAVGSVTTKKKVSFFSSRGPTKDNRIKPDVVAFGGGAREAIYSTISGKLDGKIDRKTDGFEPLRGTSMATPQISGWTALMLSKMSARLSYDEILLKTCEDLISFGKDNLTGYGLPIISKSIGYMPYPERKSKITKRLSGLFSSLILLTLGVSSLTITGAIATNLLVAEVPVLAPFKKQVQKTIETVSPISRVEKKVIGI